MTLRDVLTETERRGIRLESRDGRLRYEAPQGTITADLRAALVAYKRDLVAIVWRLEEMRRLAVHTPRSCAYARESACGGPGRCFSCGDPLEHSTAHGRCTPCDIAADLYYASKRSQEESGTWVC